VTPRAGIESGKENPTAAVVGCVAKALGVHPCALLMDPAPRHTLLLSKQSNNH
jgi:hypothetical protein